MQVKGTRVMEMFSKLSFSLCVCNKTIDFCTLLHGHSVFSCDLQMTEGEVHLNETYFNTDLTC